MTRYMLAILAAITLTGCGSTARRVAATDRPALAAATIDAAQAEQRLRAATNATQEANAEIEAAAPELSAQTGQIHAAIAELRAVDEIMLGLVQRLESEQKAASKQSKELAAANAEIGRLEDKANSTLTTILIGASVAGVALAVVCGVWLRSWQGVVTGLAIVAACAAGMWIIRYRAIIAIVGMSAAAVYAAWSIIAERKVSRDVVATVEKIKPHVPDFKALANAVQTSKFTRKAVDRIKATLGGTK